jgi:DNA-binding beta-propeller fold protein YncE
MNRSTCVHLVWLCVAVVFAAVLPRVVHTQSFGSTQSFVYTNNGSSSFSSPNTVSAFSVAADGSLIPVPGSPFLTGGNATLPGQFAANRIAVSTVGNYLYVANSDSVSGFSINPATGVLTPVPASPFPAGPVTLNGISLAVTPDGKYLIAANAESNNATVYSITFHGTLTAIPGSPFALGLVPDGIKVTPDGKFLLVAAPFAPLVGGVGVYSISPAGTLSAVAGSPFPASSFHGNAAGIDVNCSSSFAFAGEGNSSLTSLTIIDVFNIETSGFLTPIPGSPFFFPVGLNSNVPLLSPDDRKLFVSNQFSNTVTTFVVAGDGSLSIVAGSPFPVGGLQPQIMSTTRDGTFLYVANGSNNITGFSVGAQGVLTAVPGSPFSIGVTSAGLQALAVYPPKTCSVNGMVR